MPELGTLAMGQLKQWQSYGLSEATTMRVEIDEDTGKVDRIHRECLRCHQAIITEWYRDSGYILSLNTILAAIVAHLRQAHNDDVECEVYHGS